MESTNMTSIFNPVPLNNKAFKSILAEFLFPLRKTRKDNKFPVTPGKQIIEYRTVHKIKLKKITQLASYPLLLIFVEFVILYTIFLRAVPAYK